ncbi:L-aspartate oxidase [Micromonospora peucetia]|uniref:L-aspartate oxidase n=1 Tax=Micromonospora peucetia TaxID=47871 RepID=A0A1C6V3J5_9ACTN|nr:L-aspartate oxidase [Micromonospora peucetia]MCX4389089.1 L-aspartate oxidase [Micromonospora peucetia]WSA35291.1 L-aspartate oxidase [Micromonospora peucetia]SCL60707.1 L-aspartate oxidase [Micromonospora peucetia]
MDLPTVELPALPRLLAAPAPGWVETTDVIVVGSGVAGLTAALHLREAGLHVTVVTKVNIDEGSTRWAQGGIAAVLDPHDTPAAHASDTEIAGVGLCDPAAVRVLVEEGPIRLRELMRIGAEFDRNPDGSLMLTREGGHRADRIVHAGGDATGAEVQRALHAAVRRDPWIRLVEHALVLDLLRAPGDGPDGLGPACGITLHVLGEGSEDGVGAILARAVVLATGGMGQIYAATTNPAVSTGDGVALAVRAGAAVTDVEFVQFHPTALITPGGAGMPGAGHAQQPLVSEALRGEGAYLVDGDGKRFMVGQHELAELAPRDVVAKGIHRVLLATGADHVFLDARHLGGDFLARRFPTIVASCLAIGVDPATDLIPVAPAAHYASGGVRTDLRGRTSIPGLYACGEVACTGVHGANRLASNSLLEGLVFSRRIAEDIAVGLPEQAQPAPTGAWLGGEGWVLPAGATPTLQRAMTRGAGVLRSADTLAGTAGVLTGLGEGRGRPRTADWEATNLITVASTLVAAAYARRETRGCHWREDFPTADERWHGHLVGAVGAQGRLTQAWEGTR